MSSKKNSLEGYKDFLKKSTPDQFETGLDNKKIKTGILLYDEIIGGLPLGKYVLIQSEPGAGKTTLMVQLGQALQKYKNTKSLYIDSEQSMSKQRMLQLGFDTDNVIYSQPRTIEDQGRMILKTLKYKEEEKDEEPFFFLMDSNTQLPIESQINDDDILNKQPQLKQRINSAFLAKVIYPLQRTNSTLLMIAQNRTNLNMGGFSFGGPDKDVIGGEQLKYYQMQDIRLNAGSFKETESFEMYGKIVHFKQKKNRLMSPNIRFDMVLDFNRGFVNDLSNFIFFKKLKKEELKKQKFDENPLKSAGGWWKFKWNGSEEYKFRQKEFQNLYNTDETFRKYYDSQIVTFIRRCYREKFENGENGYDWIFNPDEDEDYIETYLNNRTNLTSDVVDTDIENFSDKIGENELEEIKK